MGVTVSIPLFVYSSSIPSIPRPMPSMHATVCGQYAVPSRAHQDKNMQPSTMRRRVQFQRNQLLREATCVCKDPMLASRDLSAHMRIHPLHSFCQPVCCM